MTGDKRAGLPGMERGEGTGTFEHVLRPVGGCSPVVRTEKGYRAAHIGHHRRQWPFIEQP